MKTRYREIGLLGAFAALLLGAAASRAAEPPKVPDYVTIYYSPRAPQGELTCKGGTIDSGEIIYAKCIHRSLEGYERALLNCAKRVPQMDKGQLRRVQELGAIFTVRQNLEYKIKDNRDHDYKLYPPEISSQIRGARDRIQFDLEKALRRCEEKDASFMDCGSAYPRDIKKLPDPWYEAEPKSGYPFCRAG